MKVKRQILERLYFFGSMKKDFKVQCCNIAAAQGKEFVASVSWLDKWKARFNVKFKKTPGEKQSADHSAAQRFKDERLPEFFENYHPRDIYNCGEFALYPKCLRTLRQKC